MYPHDVIFGLDLYDIAICIGILVCFFAFGKMADHLKIKGKLQNIVLFDAVFSVVLGYFGAVFMQALYNIAEIGHFEITQSTGATFYGGLIVGSISFISFYFVVGHFAYKGSKYHIENLFNVLNCAIASVVVAHAIGRIGCLMAGCCHGFETDGFWGIKMHGDMGYVKYIPVQLYESLFLFGLFACLVYRVYHNKYYNLTVYMIGYGIWRFLIEFLRGDKRGGTLVDFLSPSQFTALILIISGFLVYYLEKKFRQKYPLEEVVKTQENITCDSESGDEEET